MERIAIHCPTKDLFLKVLDKRGLQEWNEYYYIDKADTCVELKDRGMQSMKWFEREGYTIISAEKYLKEGGKEVGKCYNPDCENWTIDNTALLVKNHCRKLAGVSICDRVILSDTNNRKNNSKENNMSKSININNTIAKVFTDIPTAELVTKHLGDEYPENNHRAFLDLDLNKDAVLKEAKRLENEEKLQQED